MPERVWTDPQRDAIEARGGSVLVSAAAGSGKTAVLVERVVRLICDPVSPVDANRLLVVTFSRAAAAEMRQRIGARLSEQLRENPADVRLQMQQTLLAGAQISTVDSFCLDLVRQNFQNLAISPDFGIIDQSELDILMNACVSDCIAWFYENDDSGVFPQLVELLSAGRDDGKLPETILKIYDFSRSHPFFERWLDSKLAMYADTLSVGQTVWGQSILSYTQESLRYCLHIETEALQQMELDDKMLQAYGPAFCSDIEELRRCLKPAEAADWDGTVKALASFTFAKLGRLSGNDSLKQRVKESRDQVKDIVKDLAGKYMNATGAQFREDLDDLRPKMELLFHMVRDFARRLWEAKQQKKRLHFSDLEHLALQLLVERTGDGYAPTAQAREVASQYDYVLVDEYQDTNEVQDLLFRSVSRDEANLFMVGDVKQSIYSFRQAMPEIFMRKKETFSPYASGQYPAKIILDTNFRSRAEVTGAVNSIFGCIMSDSLGDVNYDGGERLRCGASYGEGTNLQPELLVAGVKGYQGSRQPAEIEAAMIADKIRAMLREGFQVEERGEKRPARLRDFCILMRSPKSRAEIYVREMARLGVAARAENAGGYLEAREVSVVLSFLRALDNPLLDVELVAVLLSPLFSFHADDVTRIRLHGRGKPFWIAVCSAAEDGDEKCKAFLALFSRLRTAASILPADRLIMQLYDETDALSVFRVMPLGESRRANLLLLIEYAAQYHAMGYKQLGGFVGFLGRLAERGGDLSPAGNPGDGADAVQIMSIHRSKGLEFPVVFLADTAKQFNKVDLRQNTLLHSRYGFACVRRDYRTFRQYPTVPMQAIRLEAQRSLLSEEMRILYVALTRPKEKLIITGVVNADLQKKLSGLAEEPVDGKLPSYRLRQCACYLDWILAALLPQPSCTALREIAGTEHTVQPDNESVWRVSIQELAADGPDIAEGTAATQEIQVAADPQLLQRLREQATWRYRHDKEVRTPTKLAVSDVAKGKQDVRYRFAARPKFLSEQTLTPAERGNAMHKFMQFSDYFAARDDLYAEIERMGREGFLSRAECESLQADRLHAFFSSPLATRIFGSEQIHRELKFMAECGQDMLGGLLGDIGDGKVVLQGVADCVFIEDGTAVIVDYKTDRVSTPDALRERYGTQLELYRAILSQSLGCPIGECLLYSFHLSCAVRV